MVVTFKGVALDVELVMLVGGDALAEMDPLKVKVLVEVLLLTELAGMLEVVVVIGVSVAVDLDEDRDELVRLEDSEEVMIEGVLELDFVELEDELVVLGFFELVLLVVPSIQSQSSKSCGALKALKGDEVLVL